MANLKRKYTITLGHPATGDKVHTMEAECMKTVDGNIVLMDYNEEGCTFDEVAFFCAPAGGTINVVSCRVEA